jgi:regulator of sigma E protease
MPEPTTIIAVVILLGVVILVHEWGHYLAARLCAIRVEIFSIGFGPRIWGWKRGSTDYRVSALPLGGYVKMAGDNPVEDREGAPDEFLSKPRWQRAIVAVAGPAMNILLALVTIWGLLWIVGAPYMSYLDAPAEIVAFPKDAMGAAAGLLPGDRIAEVNGTAVKSWNEVAEAYTKVESGDVLRLRVSRGGTDVAIQQQKPARGEFAALFGHSPIPPVIAQVAPGLPAATAGLQAGDRVLSVNAQPIRVWGEFTDLVRGSSGEPLQLKIKRGDAEVDVVVTPIPSQDRGRPIRQIGVSPQIPVAYRQVGFATAAVQSVDFVVEGSRQILGVLGGLLQGKVSIKLLGGPLEIARQSGIAARQGIQEFIQLMAVISLNLAILNLLPIPILDGGHLLLLAVEGSLRRDLSLAVKERFVQVGMVFLLVIFVIVMYNDVLKVLPIR